MLELALHPSDTRRPRHRIRASVQVESSSQLKVTFDVEGSEFVRWPGMASGTAVAESRVRRDELWKETCFECFIAGRDSSYTEWNFAPTGDWACYTFASYRTGMMSPSVNAPSVTKGDLPSHFEILFNPALGDVLARSVLHLSLTAVIVEVDSAEPFYWALNHAGARPDFHLRESFSLKLES